MRFEGLFRAEFAFRACCSNCGVQALLKDSCVGPLWLCCFLVRDYLGPKSMFASSSGLLFQGLRGMWGLSLKSEGLGA